MFNDREQARSRTCLQEVGLIRVIWHSQAMYSCQNDMIFCQIAIWLPITLFLSVCSCYMAIFIKSWSIRYCQPVAASINPKTFCVDLSMSICHSDSVYAAITMSICPSPTANFFPIVSPAEISRPLSWLTRSIGACQLVRVSLSTFGPCHVSSLSFGSCLSWSTYQVVNVYLSIQFLLCFYLLDYHVVSCPCQFVLVYLSLSSCHCSVCLSLQISRFFQLVHLSTSILFSSQLSAYSCVSGYSDLALSLCPCLV